MSNQYLSEAEWRAAKESLTLRGVGVETLSDAEVEVLFSACVMMAIRVGSSRDEIVRAVDAIIKANTAGTGH